jgi:hypothetical protein
MARPLSIFCKSYKTDLRRVQRLLQSIEKYNEDEIPVYISVPSEDVVLFEEHLKGFNASVLSDLDVVSKNSNVNLDQFLSLPGNISQQIVKSEFWRLDYSENYVCIDSDAIFIRPFHSGSYLSELGTPYTVIDQGHEILNDSLRKSRQHVINNFFKESRKIKTTFDRNGIDYSFGPFPVVWSSAVWASLEKNFLFENQISILDAICQCPVESHWYGEALLKYNAIPVLPRQPIFYVYHYGWQYNEHKKHHITETDLALIYDGVIYQSAWEREMDWPSEGGNTASRLARRFRRAIGAA